jgi:hypothetical protein
VASGHECDAYLVLRETISVWSIQSFWASVNVYVMILGGEGLVSDAQASVS